MPTPHPQPVRGGSTPTAESVYARDLVFFLNGQRVRIEDVSPATLLVDYLRSNEVALTGTKIGCKQGGCGACTVLLSRYDPATKTVSHRAINSCLRPLASLDGMMVTTIEGMGGVQSAVSPVQYCLAKNNGTQCGYCTPGWVMSAHGCLASRGIEHLALAPGTDRADPHDPSFARLPSKQQLQQHFDGNLCRCTGYRPILFGFQKGFARDWCDADQKGAMTCAVDPMEMVAVSSRIAPPVPPGLTESPRALAFARDGYQWIRPTSLAELQALILQFPDEGDRRLVCGNTSIGVYDRYVEDPHVLIDIAHIAELRATNVDAAGLTVGAGVTYHDFIALLDEQIAAAQPGHAERLAGLQALRYLAQRTGGNILRDAASLGGNTMLVMRHITSGTPFPSDLFTAFASVGAQLLVWNSATGMADSHDLLEYAAQYVASPEVRSRCLLLGYRIPFTTAAAQAETYKIALREVNAHSIVNAGFVTLLDAERRVTSARLVVAGIGPVAVNLDSTVQAIMGRAWDWEVFEAGQAALTTELTALASQFRDRLKDVPWEGFTDADRLGFAQSFWLKFFVKVALAVNPAIVTEEQVSAAQRTDRPVSRGTQRYNTYEAEFPINLPYVKLEAFLQATGEAIYPQDVALSSRGLEGAYVCATRAKAEFCYTIPEKTDVASPAEVLACLQARFPGIVGYLTACDLTEAQNLQGFGKDQPVFAPMQPSPAGWLIGSVKTDGQSLGLVLAEDHQVALDAANFVGTSLVRYRTSTPVISIADAVNAGSLFPDNPKSNADLSHVWKVIRPGSDTAWAGAGGNRVQLNGAACTLVTGRQVVGSQIHFYMETQTCVAVPGEAGHILLQSSTQDASSVQASVAGVLGLAMNQVDVRVRRIGGGYGGKCSAPNFVAIAAAVAARRFNRQVRIAVRRENDTMMFGHRHPAQGDFTVAIGDGSDSPANKGRLMGLQNQFLLNGGWTYDFSFVVGNCLQLRADTAYFIPNYITSCDVGRTNTVSSTSFRTMGMIQGIMLQEEALEKAAYAIGMAPEDVRRKNLYVEKQATPVGQVLTECYLDWVFDYTRKTYGFDQRQAEVEAFNQQNRYRKRGISLIPLKYGSGWNLPLLEQAGALVNVFASDGTVLVRTGGIEMGQGLNIKIAQVASFYLGVPLALIRQGEMDTSIVPQATSTGASTGSPFNAEAVRACCTDLCQRLIDFCHSHIPKLPCPTAPGYRWKVADWKTAVGEAYAARLNLSSQQRIPIEGGSELDNAGISYHQGVNGGQAPGHFTGYTFSAAIAEVEIDVLTGESTVLRADIVYDAGRSQNPAVDVGQVEGAFVQGIGYLTSEERVFQPDGPRQGSLNTTNTWNYKPPAVTSIPLQMNVDLFPDPENNSDPLTSSKEVGEPPMALAATVFFAIKHAIMAARRDRGFLEWIELEAPATVTRVRRACAS